MWEVVCGKYGAWDPEGILDCHIVWDFRSEEPKFSSTSVTSPDSTAGQIIKRGRKKITTYCRGNILENGPVKMKVALFPGIKKFGLLAGKAPLHVDID